MGHRGISIHHYSFDRAVYGSMVAKFHHRHEMELAERQAASTAQGVSVDPLDEHRSWVCGTVCAHHHDSHNALKWAMSGCLEDPETLKKLHVGVESIRNSFHLIMQVMNAFLIKHMSYWPGDYDAAEVERLWTAMGVVPKWTFKLSRVSPRWLDGVLRVSLPVNANAEGRKLAVSSIAHLMRFQKFADSRWFSMGTSCRGLVCALLVGLDEVVKMARELPQASEYYAHGWDGLGADVKRCACSIAVVS